MNAQFVRPRGGGMPLKPEALPDRLLPLVRSDRTHTGVRPINQTVIASQRIVMNCVKRGIGSTTAFARPKHSMVRYIP